MPKNELAGADDALLERPIGRPQAITQFDTRIAETAGVRLEPPEKKDILALLSGEIVLELVRSWIADGIDAIQIVDSAVVSFEVFYELPVKEVGSIAFHADIACRSKQIDSSSTDRAADHARADASVGRAQHDLHFERLRQLRL